MDLESVLPYKHYGPNLYFSISLADPMISVTQGQWLGNEDKNNNLLRGIDFITSMVSLTLHPPMLAASAVGQLQPHVDFSSRQVSSASPPQTALYDQRLYFVL